MTRKTNLLALGRRPLEKRITFAQFKYLTSRKSFENCPQRTIYIPNPIFPKGQEEGGWGMVEVGRGGGGGGF